MKNKNVILLAAIFMTSLFSLETFAQKSVFLQYNLNAGDQYRHELNIENTIEMEVQGQSMTLDQESSFELVYLVTKVDKDSIFLQVVIEALKISQSVAGMEITYDSQDTTTYNSPVVGTKISDEMNKLIGEKITAVMDRFGNVGTVDMGTLKDKNITENFKNSFSGIIYPGKKVKVGESWENDVISGGVAEIKMHVVYTLASIKGKQAYIKFQGDLEGVDKSDELKGTASGEIVVNRKTGWMIKKESSEDYNMMMEQGGMSFPATVSGEYEITVKKL